MARKRKPRPQPETTKAGADRHSADLVIVLGVPETGKSAYVKRLIAPEPRLVVWDPNDEYQYQSCRRVRSLLDLQYAMLRAGAGPARLAFVTDDIESFPRFCRLARAWAQPVAGRAPCAVAIEELSDVVPPGRAPRELGQLLRAGRHRGIKVRAVGHSPMEIDKTTLRMATTWHVHMLGTPVECEYMADLMRIDQAHLDPLQPFDYVEVSRLDPFRKVEKSRTSPI